VPLMEEEPGRLPPMMHAPTDRRRSEGVHPHVDAVSPTGAGRFTLLATSIAGRLVEVEPAGPGELCWTDGRQIYVDEGLPSADQLRSVGVQAALLGAGSLDTGIVGQLRKPDRARRYLAVEGHRALAQQRDFLPPPLRAGIDWELAGRSDSPARSLALALVRDRVPLEPPPFFGCIKPRVIKDDAGAGGSDATYQHRPAAAHEQALDELDDDERIASTMADIFSSPGGRGGAVGRLLKNLFTGARSKGSGQPGAESATHWSKSGASSNRDAAVSLATVAVTEAVGDAEATGFAYPEWDVHHHRYKPRWCVVNEEPADPLEPVTMPNTSSLRRAVGRLGMDLELARRQLQGDDFDLDAVVEHRVDLKSGASGTESLYLGQTQTKRDLAVLILVDVSGSSGEPSHSGTTVHTHQIAATAALMGALDALGDRVAVYGFRSHGRHAVQFQEVKAFRDRLDLAALRRLGGLRPGGYTRLGAAIRHGSAILEQRSGAPRRLLIVISDGFAYDHGYEGAYGEADARRALSEARRAGTACVCLSIAARTESDALGRVFGTAAYARLPRAELPPVLVGTLFSSALKTAEAKRRTTERQRRSHNRQQRQRSFS